MRLSGARINMRGTVLGQQRRWIPFLVWTCVPYFTGEHIAACQPESLNVRNRPHAALKVVICGSGEAATAALVEASSILHEGMKLDVHYVPVTDLSTNGPTIDIFNKALRLEGNRWIKYDKCLLAFDRPLAPLLERIIDDDLLSKNSVFFDARSPENLKHLEKIVSEGCHVTIVGANNWSNIHAAGYLANVARRNGYVNSVSLVYPGYGPMSSYLPRYVSLMLASRLVSRGVELIPYSQLNYVGAVVEGSSDKKNTKSHDNKRASTDKLNAAAVVYVARTYDSINSTNFPTDAVVLGPGSISQSWQDNSEELRLLPEQRTTVHSLLHTQFEIDRNLGGIPLNRSLEVGNGLYVAGECANVFFSGAPWYSSPTSQNSSTLSSPFSSYRRVIQGEFDARSSARAAMRIMMGQGTFYNKPPCEVSFSADVNMSFVAVGLCNPSVESHSYWWKINEANLKQQRRSGSSSSSASTVAGKPVLSEYIKRDLKRAFSITGRDIGDASGSVHHHTLGPRGKFAVYQSSEVLSKGASSVASTDQSIQNMSTWSYKQLPLGLGVTLFVDNFRIVGVLLSGFPIGRAFTYQKMDDARIEMIEDVVRRYLDRCLLSEEQLRLVGEGVDYDRFGFMQQVSVMAEHILNELGEALSACTDNDVEVASTAEKRRDFAEFMDQARKQYRHCPPSRSTTSEMNEHLYRSLIGKQPHSIAEPLFMLKSNTGSRSDRQAAAYSTSIMHAMAATTTKDVFAPKSRDYRA